MNQEQVLTEIKQAIADGLELSGPWGRLVYTGQQLAVERCDTLRYTVAREHEHWLLAEIVDGLERTLVSAGLTITTDVDGCMAADENGIGLVIGSDKLTTLWEAYKKLKGQS